MKMKQRAFVMNSISCYPKRFNFFGSLRLPLAVLWLAPLLSANGATMGKSFSSPEEAVRALSTAVNNDDTNALGAIFGPAFDQVRSADPVQAQEEVTDFAARINESHHIDRDGSGRAVLEIGEDQFPFAIPIVQKSGSWYFDTEAGKDELINRRIGRNELEALKSMRAYVDAQREYASKDHTGNEVLKYAQKIISTPGTKDGLYWPPDSDGEDSPLGPLFAEAQSRGYLKGSLDQNEPQPFHGYFFKILTKQGKHPPGGAYNYIINGNMIGGFGMVAWPADYGDSGIMTFVINQQGKVYQKDLGKNTQAIVKKMEAYDPDSGWKLSKD
jgi:hypothetical protein